MHNRSISILLWFLVILSTTGWGSETSVDGEFGPGFWAGQFSPVTLDSEVAANDLATKLIHNFSLDPNRQENPVVEVIHLKGQRLSPYLENVLLLLGNAGFEVRGTFVDEQDFSRAEHELKIAYPIRYSEASVRDRRRMKSRIFGLPQGFTVFCHFFQQGGKRKGAFPPARFPFDPGVFTFAATATGIVALNNLIVRGVGNWWLQEPMPPLSEVGATSGFISLWVFFFLNLRREFMSMKAQGSSVVQDPKAAAGKQIRLKTNRTLFTTANLIQDYIFIGSLTAVLYAFGNVEITNFHEAMGELVNLILTGTASALAYTNFDAVIADMSNKAEKLRYSDPETSYRIRKEIKSLSQVFYCGLLPMARNIALFLEGRWKQGPLAALALAGWLWKTAREGWHLRPNGKVVPTPAHLSCSALIAIH